MVLVNAEDVDEEAADQDAFSKEKRALSETWSFLYFSCPLIAIGSSSCRRNWRMKTIVMTLSFPSLFFSSVSRPLVDHRRLASL